MAWTMGAVETPSVTPPQPPEPNANTITLELPPGRSTKIVRNRRDSNVVEIHVNKADKVVVK